MPPAKPPSRTHSAPPDSVARLLDTLRQNGWHVSTGPRIGHRVADLALSKDGIHHIAILKSVPEGRRDRMVPALAQALLEACAIVKASPIPAEPLAVVFAPCIVPAVLTHLEKFLADNAPGVTAAFLDREGLVQFRGPDLESGFDAFNRSPARRPRSRKIALPESGQLFSDLNQWMLKVLLAPEIRAEMLSAPRGDFRNASEFAKAAHVSLMSAFRFLRQMRSEGFLDEEDEVFRVIRREELMRRWQAVYLRSVADLPMRWIERGTTAHRLGEALHFLRSSGGPRCCLGLFAAANALGQGFQHDLTPHLYVEKLDAALVRSIGLSTEGAEHQPDLLLRVPLYRESVFRGAVERQSLPVSDILQVWLDASLLPARGKAEAEELRMRVLTPLFQEAFL
jgi:hypothetical protein